MKANRRRPTEGDLSSFSKVEQRSGECVIGHYNSRRLSNSTAAACNEFFRARAALGRGKSERVIGHNNNNERERDRGKKEKYNLPLPLPTTTTSSTSTIPTEVLLIIMIIF